MRVLELFLTMFNLAKNLMCASCLHLFNYNISKEGFLIRVLGKELLYKTNSTLNPRGVLEVYMTGGGGGGEGPTELHIANPKKYTSLKF